MKRKSPRPRSAAARLDAVVRTRFKLSWTQARTWIETGKIWHDGKPITDPSMPTEEDTILELKMNAPKQPATGRLPVPASLIESDVVFVDSHVIVVNKKAGLSSVPFEPNEIALEQLVGRYLNQRVTVVHRLDRETSGLLVFARTVAAATSLAAQFRDHTVARHYLALAQGTVSSQTIRSSLIKDRGDGLRGSLKSGNRRENNLAKPAVTHLKVLEQLAGATLLECRLETGRTHQIRIHLSEAGHPLLGEKAYNREYSGAIVEAPRLMLHAAELGFVHPARGEAMKLTLPPPPDFLAVLTHLRKVTR